MVTIPELTRSVRPIALLHESVGWQRIEAARPALEMLSKRDLAPDLGTVARWVERIAAQLPNPTVGASRWADFFDDIAVIFAAAPTALAGRQILIDSDSKIRPCNAGRSPQSTRSVIYFQPARRAAGGAEDEDAEPTDLAVDVPAYLKRRLRFVHPDLIWRSDGRKGPRRVCRDFFERHGLIQGYDTRGLLQHVERLLRGNRGDRLRRDAHQMDVPDNLQQRPAAN